MIGKKVIIVEPHFDDAWLDLGGYILLNKSKSFFLLTLSDHPTNKEDGTKILSRYLPNLSGRFLGYKSLGFDDDSLDNLIKKYHTEDYEELFSRLNRKSSLDSIARDIESNCSEFDTVFWPLGLKHPQHILMDKLRLQREGIVLYREYPYFLYEDQKHLLEEKTAGKQEKAVDIKEVMDIKIDLFKKAYPRQSFILSLGIGGKDLKDIKKEVYWE